MASKKTRARPVATATEAATPATERFPSWAAVSLLAALPLLLLRGVLFSRGLLAGTPRDLLYQHLPWRVFGFSELRQGRLALWNPHIFGGAPFFGGFQSALLYPPNWLHLFLPAAAAINLYLALHLFLAGLFAYLWCRGRGAGPLAACAAGSVFMLSGPFYLHVYAGQLPQIGSMAWVPAILWCLDGWAAQGSAGWLLGGMAAVALQILAGSPQHVYYTGLFCAIYCAARPLPEWKRAFAGLAAVYAGSVLLSAVQLWTGFAASREIARAGAGRAFAAMFSLPPESAATLAAPFLFGDDVRTAFFGRTYLWESSLFVGAAACVLAGLGLTAPRRRALSLWIGLAAALLLALGARTPLFSVLYALLPGYRLFRGTAKFSLFAILCLSGAVALGLEELRTVRPLRKAAVSTAAAGAFLLLAAWVLPSAWGRDAIWDPFMALIAASHESDQAAAAYFNPAVLESTAREASGTLAEAGGLLLLCAALLEAARVRRDWARLGLAALALGESYAFAAAMSVSFSAPSAAPAAWRGADPSGERRVLDPYPGTSDFGMLFGGDGVWGYDPFVQRRYAEFIAATQGLPPQAASQYMDFHAAPPIYRLLRVGKDALPRLSLLRDYRLATDAQERLDMLLAPDFDPTRTVLLESAPRPPPEPGSGGGVSVLDAAPGRLDIQADLPKAALLLITDAYSAAWRAVPLEPGAQKRYEVLPADHAFMAVPLAAGHHRLRLEYDPLAFRLGLWATLLSLAAWSAACLGLALRGLQSPAGFH